MKAANAHLASRIKLRLAELDRDAQWLADVLEVHPSTIGRYLAGTLYPTDARLRELARALHRPVGYFTAMETLVSAPASESAAVAA